VYGGIGLSKKRIIAINQSNYIPWKGYFDMINMVDDFVLYDTVQYTKRDWRNRNKIKTKNGLQWLTIPVNTKNNYYQEIDNVQVSNNKWSQKHWNSIVINYSKTKFFKEYKDIFEDLYLNCKSTYLSEINYKFIITINNILNINTNIIQSSEFNLPSDRNKKLIHICKELNASTYLSGPAAKSYIDENLFKNENIEINWMNYDNYPEYNQLFSPFEHNVSILDLIFNEGSNAKNFMRSF
jgi:hypothetical protein